MIKELVIEWDENTGSPRRAYVRPQAFTARTKVPVRFQGNPNFNQNLVNKKYFPEQRTWIFIDS